MSEFLRQPGEEQQLQAPEPIPAPDLPSIEASAAQQVLFSNIFPPGLPSQERIPHIGHLFLLGLLAFTAVFCSAMLLRIAVTFNVFGVHTLDQAVGNIRYTLAGEALTYLLTLFAALLVFPLVWRRSLLRGLHWNGSAAWRHCIALGGIALLCFLFALVNDYFMPGPKDAPIERTFQTPGAAWLLFAFGVSMAPLFEEMFFRGFLLPALCTAFDWVSEQVSSVPPRRIDADGNPRWSRSAMAVASIVTSLPFALMHAAQTGKAVGALVLLFVISLVLCAVRLSMRSLASSVLVHAFYNFLLFFFMYLGTGGFKHLENM